MRQTARRNRFPPGRLLFSGADAASPPPGRPIIPQKPSEQPPLSRLSRPPVPPLLRLQSPAFATPVARFRDSSRPCSRLQSPAFATPVARFCDSSRFCLRLQSPAFATPVAFACDSSREASLPVPPSDRLCWLLRSFPDSSLVRFAGRRVCCRFGMDAPPRVRGRIVKDALCASIRRRRRA